MEATAKYDFDPTAPDELPFRKGHTIKIINLEDDHWYQAEMNGRTGFVPSTYLDMENHEWYKGSMSRTESEALLMAKFDDGSPKYQEGTFVIRDCQADKNQFSLSVKYRGHPDVQHFKIMSTREGEYYLWPEKTFLSINRLIDHHRNVSVAREPHTNILLRDMPAYPVQQARTTIFEAMYNFTPQGPEEISFKKGDRIELLGEADPNWLSGRVLGTNTQGLFPCNYVKKVQS